jgi:hypothetical protein
MDSEADCGLNTSESLARYDLGSSSWKTSQICLTGELSELSGAWPKSGMTRNGKLYPQPPLVPTISENESGLLPTPIASNTKHTHMRTIGRPPRTYLPTPRAIYGEHPGMTDPRHLTGAARLWATPTARDWRSESCSEEYFEERESHPRGKPLAWQTKYATPQARDYRTGQAARWDNPNRSRNLNDQAGGKLSVIFVEWLMGYPIGWTALEPLETVSSLKSLSGSEGES